MSDVIECQEKQFDEVADFGDNTDRVNWVMMNPTLGATSMLRYKPSTNTLAKVNCLALNCDFGALLLSGAYAAAQNGAIIRIQFDGTTRFEHKFNWTGLSGYIGGADDYNAENEILLTGFEMEIAANTVIRAEITGGTNVRKMVYAELHGTLDDGTVVREAVKRYVDGTSAQTLDIYTVPAGRILYWECLTITTRHIDLYAAKGYLVYNGMPVMVMDIMQTEVGGVNGLVFPLWELPITEGNSIGFRCDSFECGYEILSATAYSHEVSLAGARTSMPVYQLGVV